MAISTVVARGFGSFGGGVSKLPTRGYSIASAPVSNIYIFLSGGIQRNAVGTGAVQRTVFGGNNVQRNVALGGDAGADG